MRIYIYFSLWAFVFLNRTLDSNNNNERICSLNSSLERWNVIILLSWSYPKCRVWNLQNENDGRGQLWFEPVYFLGILFCLVIGRACASLWMPHFYLLRVCFVYVTRLEFDNSLCMKIRLGIWYFSNFLTKIWDKKMNMFGMIIWFL